MSPVKSMAFVYGVEPDWLGALQNSSPMSWASPSADGGRSVSHGIMVRELFHAFIGGACPVCQTASNLVSTMSRCSNCKLVRYCSRGHQRQDWPRHRSFCRWIAPAGRSRLATDLRDHSQWLAQQWRLVEQFAAESTAGLDRLDSMLFFCAPVCALCYRPDAAVECAECCSTFYCCREHQTQDAARHGKACGHLRLILLRQQHICKYRGVVLPPVLFAPATVYTPLTGTIHSVINDQLNALQFFQTADSACQTVPVAVAKDMLSESLTVLYALQKTLPAVEERTSLTIHYVHKDETPYFDILVLWEYLLHRLPRLERLRLVFVLLEELDNPQPPLLKAAEYSPCQDCRRRGRRVLREHARASDLSETPDMVVWFNVAKHKPRSGLRLRLPGRAVPVLLTASSSDVAVHILTVLEKTGVRPSLPLHMQLAPNPFHSVMPFPDPTRSSVHQDVAFPMQYMVVLNCHRV